MFYSPRMMALDPAIWRRLLERRPSDAHLSALYGPLVEAPAAPDGTFVLGRIAQSLDGRIATPGGRSHWISGDADIAHTHRLRALSDAVVIGAGTIRADNPQLTTRHVEGPSPVRVVIDTDRRLHDGYRVFRDGPETLLICASDRRSSERLGAARVLGLPRHGAGLDPRSVIDALGAHGLRRIFVEGGGVTVSRFLAAGALDRLHVTVARLLLGAGIPAFTLPPPSDPSEALHVDWIVHQVGGDVLFDIPLGRARPASCM